MQPPLVAELLEIPTAEDRLEWIVSRSKERESLPQSLCTDAYKVPQCVTGLWVEVLPSSTPGRFSIRCRANAQMVFALATFVADVLQSLTRDELLTFDEKTFSTLGLSGLVTSTRQLALIGLVQSIKKQVEKLS